jgi:adenylate cyclase
MRSFLDELRRRNVIRVAGLYAVVGWVLVQIVVSIKTPLSLPAWTDTLVIVLLGIGFPIAVLLAWAFELTPEGVKLTRDAGPDAPPSAKPLDYAVLAGFALVIALIVADRLLPDDEPQPPPPAAQAQQAAADPAATPAAPAQAQVTPPAASIAVLPFADLSPAHDQEYFSDGMAEEILNVLARIEGLKVASRTSAFQFRSVAKGIPVIARELGVRHVLEGSVRRSGDSIRVTAQLIDASSDQHLWSDTFDAQLNAENVFAIQDQIANAIVVALRERIGLVATAAAPASPVRTSNVEAYELFLKARALFQARRSLGDADLMIEQALAIDPRFAEALAMRAAIYQFGGEYGAQLGDEVEARKHGREFAAAALAIDPDNSLALAITALSHTYDHIEGYGSEPWDAIFARYERSLALDHANANAMNWQGITHAFVGDNEHAAEAHRRCVEVDPALAACRSNLAIELLALGRREEAASVLDGPGQMILLSELGRRDAFLLLSLNVPALRGFHRFDALYEALHDPDNDDRALAAELRTLIGENKGSRRVHTLLNVLGDYRDPLLITTHWIPGLRGYRQSPEFRQHMRASGVVDYWRAKGFPPMCRPLGGEDFECD